MDQQHNPDIEPALEEMQQLLKDSREVGLGRMQLDEATFRREWLGAFAGGEGYLNANKWVFEVAGSYYTPVDVMKNGEVVFTIPPITTPVLPTEENGAWNRASNELDVQRQNNRRSQTFSQMVEQFTPETRDNPTALSLMLNKVFDYYELDVVAYRAGLHCRDQLGIDPESEAGQAYIAEVKRQVKNPSSATNQVQSSTSDGEDGGWDEEVL